MAVPTLEDLLVRTRLLSSVQVAVVKRDAEIQRKRLAPTLIDLGLVDEARFADWAAQTSELRLLHPLPDDEVVALGSRIPGAVARQYEVVPVSVAGDELTVATIDPFDRGAVDLLHITTGMKIRPVVARHSEVTRLVNRLYPDEEFGTETLVATGSKTQIFTPRPPESEPSQLDRIEAQLAAVSQSIEALDRRIAAIDAILSRVLSRE